MQWEFVIAILIAIPVILFPAAFVWYLDISGVYKLIKEARLRRANRVRRRTTLIEKQPDSDQ